MKLHKTLKVNGVVYPVIDSRLELALFSPGRGVFTLEANTDITGIVEFSMSYDSNSMKIYFIGFVESCTEVDSRQKRIFCREISGALQKKMKIALRDVNLTQVLSVVSQKTGLQFSYPKTQNPYLSKKTAAFYSFGNGYLVMTNLSRVFDVPKLLWQQESSGRIFVGSWDDSRYPLKPIVISRTWETGVMLANGATIPVAPAIRPGVLYNGAIITSVEMKGTQMTLTWDKNPWGRDD